MRVCVFLGALGEILWSSWVAFGHLGTLWESPRGSLKSLQDHLGEALGTPCGPPGWPLGTLGPRGGVLGIPEAKTMKKKKTYIFSRFSKTA